MKTITILAVTLFLAQGEPVSNVQKAPQQSAHDRAWTILKAGLASKITSRRTLAVRALGLIGGSPAAVESAENALKDKDPEVRQAAAKSLGEMGCTDCIVQLREALDDKETHVVLAAAQALLELKDSAAYNTYFEVLTGKRKTKEGLVTEGVDTLKDKKKMAQYGLEEGLGFIPFGSYGYTAVQILRQDDVSPLRAQAAQVLAADPDPRSGEALLQATSDKNWIVRTAALAGLAKRGDPQYLSAIVKNLSDQNLSARYAAAAAVIRLSG